MDRRLDALQHRLGHHFAQPPLLTRALTHRSASRDHNERLELLGDAGLNPADAILLTERNAVSRYNTLFFVRRDSPIQSLEDLRGRTLALQSTASTSAYMVPLTTLLAARLSPEILRRSLGSEVPPTLKLAPQWNMRLSELAPRLTAELARRGSWQGARFDAVRRA